MIRERYIWTMWWQGENSAPDLVKKCIANMRKYANGANVIVLNQTNYKDFVTIPDIIDQKFREGKMTITHLSDIIRFQLLDKYGGLWMDSTIFVSNNIPKDIFDYDFYSIKDGANDLKCISKNRWTSFLIGGKAGNEVFDDVSNMFIKYWERYDSLFIYLFIDFYLNYEYKKSDVFRRQVDNLPCCDYNVYDLKNHINNIYDIDNSKYTKGFQKLNWRYTEHSSKSRKFKSLMKHVRKLLNVKRINTLGFAFVWIDFWNGILRSNNSNLALQVSEKYNDYVEKMDIY